jgi:hypothetical protein
MAMTVACCASADFDVSGGHFFSQTNQTTLGALLGISGDHDTGGDIAAGVVGGVMQRRQHPPDVDVLGVHLLLRWRPFDQHRRLWLAERAADELTDAAEVRTEGGFDIGLAG